MNGIEAAERLRELNGMLPYLENSVEMASDDREDGVAHALSKLVGKLLAERDELERKLSEVTL